MEKKKSFETFEKPQKVLVLCGPTACGKSDFSLLLARALGGEIISADAIQVYRGLDIGTAKLSKSRREAVPHHLIDIRELCEPFNVVDFYYEARRCCQKILALNKTPLVVGGSGFYVRTLLYGPPEGPPSVPEVRRQLEEELEEKGALEMYRKLKELDPEYAETITLRDKQKIARGLEIIALTGKRVSAFSWGLKRFQRRYDFRCWFLYRPKESLYRRIEGRCEKMLALGLLEEVARLKERGLEENPSASQAIGYRQSLEFLETEMGREEYLDFLSKFKAASRRYAKRQMTWFQKEPFFRWLDLDLYDPEVAAEMVIRDYERD